MVTELSDQQPSQQPKEEVKSDVKVEKEVLAMENEDDLVKIVSNKNEGGYVHNSLKSRRRMEIYFRGRYLSIDSNVNMKEKINKFLDKKRKQNTWAPRYNLSRAVS